MFVESGGEYRKVGGEISGNVPQKLYRSFICMAPKNVFAILSQTINLKCCETFVLADISKYCFSSTQNTQQKNVQGITQDC